MKIAIAVLFAFIVIKSVYGYGLASDYLENRTMYLAPGETRQYKVEIQNNDDNQVRFRFDLDSDIAEVKDPEQYYVVGGSSKIQPVVLEITAPRNVSPGTTYDIRYSSRPLTESGSQVGLNIQLSDKFKVLIEGEPVPEENSNVLPIAFGILALILSALVLFAVFRKNEKLTRRIFKK